MSMTVIHWNRRTHFISYHFIFSIFSSNFRSRSKQWPFLIIGC